MLAVRVLIAVSSGSDASSDIAVVVPDSSHAIQSHTGLLPAAAKTNEKWTICNKRIIWAKF
jgi:hypothetical protein